MHSSIYPRNLLGKANMGQLDAIMPNTSTPSSFGGEVFEQIVSNAPFAISITDESGNILFVNDTFCRITGYTVNELIGQHSSMLSYKATPRTVYENLWSAITSGQHWQGQLINRKKCGEPYIADMSISKVDDDKGQTRYYAIHKDITEKHHLQTHQQNQSIMFQAVLNAAPLAIALVDQSHNAIFKNDRFERMNLSLDESPVQLLLDTIQMDYGYDTLEEFMGNKTQKYKGIHIESKGPMRERWFDFVLVRIPVSDTTAETYFNREQGYYIVVAINERTREKLLVEERRINAVKLMTHDNKYVHAMQEALMATLHQLQGPFNMIESAINILKRTNATCPGLLAMDEAMNTAVQAMDDIKQAVPERTSEAFQPVNLNLVVKDATSISTDELLLSSIDLNLSLDAQLPVLNGMPHRLVLALKQLLDNAIDSIQASKAKDRTIQVSTYADEHYVHLVVEDTGQGVDESIQLKIFQPFFSTKPKHKSGCRGIGLSIVQQVLNEHAATIEVARSYQLKGARVLISFPMNEW
ncbi:nitrogen fixation negative regulator NifL [Vibrio salinus]|uniref:nitrogen fixation negative regulator NifL n=1 Tax=Vibrio salinus TaxID=2899784 RepID=UPI001E481AF5|nr:nitrogen fixation negative regulator NifL [Vibrio salinus]MCE0495519.1 nitrogen fixation negative regulator NifL [Vibrio salinus]